MELSSASGLLSFIKYILFGRAEVGDIIRRHKVVSFLSFILTMVLVLTSYSFYQSVSRTQQLTEQTKLRTVLQQNFDSLVPLDTPPEKAPYIIIKELMRIQYESKQCRNELAALTEVMHAGVNDRTTEHIQSLLDDMAKTKIRTPPVQ